jgi:hypothetical protein
MTYSDPGDQTGRVVDSTDPKQQGLFEPRARNTDPDTSHMAAASMKKGAQGQRARIYKHLQKHGPLTGDALDGVMGWNSATSNRRLPELRELGLVVMLDDTAVTRSGRKARLWAAR